MASSNPVLVIVNTMNVSKYNKRCPETHPFMWKNLGQFVSALTHPFKECIVVIVVQ